METSLADPTSHLAVHSLPQLTETSKEYQLAVAANTEAGSSGMVWSSCTVINNRQSGALSLVQIPPDTIL